VALARSLAPQPRLLMLDEPLGSLDRALRERLLLDIRSILKRLDMTAVFVTHDQSEALSVADRIAVMNRGRIEQVTSPETLYMAPESLFVAHFLGFQNLLAGKVAPNGGVETEAGLFYPAAATPPPGTEVTLVIRPEGARLATPGSDAGSRATVTGRVAARLFNGQTYRVTVALDGEGTLVFDLPNWEPPPLIGEAIVLFLSPLTMATIPR
jgi:ABC-type Fe3+/spermidine/putrescine transport system ATPase subunit